MLINCVCVCGGGGGGLIWGAFPKSNYGCEFYR